MMGIKSSEFDATKNNVTANRDNFTDFDTVKNLFVEFRRLQHASRPASTSRKHFPHHRLSWAWWRT